MSEVLERARAYEMEQGQLKRPDFHVTPQVGWMNDPNGFSQYQGEYHLFFQYHPYTTQWGPMHWGHVRSKDLMVWEDLPCALAPDTEYDGQGCFSGSAVEHCGKHALIYTGVVDKQDDDAHVIRQRQCVAIGDGRDYEKLPENPVVTELQLPEGASKEDFRDPKVYWAKDHYEMVVGNRAADGSGQILLYQSKDLHAWEFVSVLKKCNLEIGKMWECPDYFELDGKKVLIFSPQEMEATEEYHNGNCSLAMIGQEEDGKREFMCEGHHSLDYGLDFYAPQTIGAEDGRRILIGWLQSWDNHFYPSELKWSGMMSLPRELHIEDKRIRQRPIREISKYYKDPVHKVCKISKRQQIEGIKGRSFDLNVQLQGNDYDRFKISVGVDEAHRTTFCYDKRAHEVEMDRTYSGMKMDRIATRKLVLPEGQEGLQIRMIVDQYSMEVFLEDGTWVMSMLFFTPLEADQIEFEAVGTATAQIDFHRISRA